MENYISHYPSDTYITMIDYRTCSLIGLVYRDKFLLGYKIPNQLKNYTLREFLYIL